MSRKPDTPTEDKGVAGNSALPDRDAGRRFTSNREILDVEAELVADGVELDNRAIPVKHHAQNQTYSKEEIDQIINEEVAKDHPNRNLIGYLNECKP